MSSTIRMTGLVSNLDTESIVAALMSVQKYKLTKIENKKTELEWKQDIWKELNTKIYSFYTDWVGKLKLQKNYNSKSATSSDTSVATATATSTAATGTHTLKVNQLASSQFITGSSLSSSVTTSTKLTDSSIGMTTGTEIKFGSTSFKVTDSSTLSDFISAAKSAGVSASYDSTLHKVFLSSSSGKDNAFTLSSSADGQLEKLGLVAIDSNTAEGTVTSATDSSVSVSYVKAKNAQFTLDGASLEESSNSFTVAGLSLSLLNTTSSGSQVSISVSSDSQATYDMVKDFISQYNDLLGEMNDYYYADSASDYTPLTDDQKSAMTDSAVEKWETKIKDSLLRRDDKLGSLISSMKSALSSSVTVGSKDYSLSTYGIVTSTDYTEKGLLHIYGNSDDSTYSSEDDKLLAAIQSNPDQVTSALTGIISKLSSTMQDKMKSSTLNSALTFYNDKEITSQISDYGDEIDDWEDRLSDMENRYYAQFTAMETALASLNSQSSALSSLLSS